jgi:hypothetical protein
LPGEGRFGFVIPLLPPVLTVGMVPPPNWASLGEPLEEEFKTQVGERPVLFFACSLFESSPYMPEPITAHMVNALCAWARPMLS